MSSELKKGDKIPGSLFYRDFCHRCGEPLRVSNLNEENYCEDCEPGPRSLSARSGLSGKAATAEDDGSPAWDNAVRAMEEN